MTREAKPKPRKWRWVVMQAFQNGRTRRVTCRPTKREAKIAAGDIANYRALIHTFVFIKRERAR